MWTEAPLQLVVQECHKRQLKLYGLPVGSPCKHGACLSGHDEGKLREVVPFRIMLEYQGKPNSIGIAKPTVHWSLPSDWSQHFQPYAADHIDTRLSKLSVRILLYA